jgi:hypothetical protein
MVTLDSYTVGAFSAGNAGACGSGVELPVGVGKSGVADNDRSGMSEGNAAGVTDGEVATCMLDDAASVIGDTCGIGDDGAVVGAILVGFCAGAVVAVELAVGMMRGSGTVGAA